jgi:hypothetical protein
VVIGRIELAFAATGKTGSGWGMANSRLVGESFYPLAGDAWSCGLSDKGTLQYSKAHSFSFRSVLAELLVSSFTVGK